MSDSEGEWAAPFGEETHTDHFGYLASGGDHLAPGVMTMPGVIRRMMEIAQVTADDLVIDVGCGDGRVLIEAAKTKRARCIGIDLFEDRVQETLHNAKEAGVEDLVSAYCVDARDWSGWDEGSVIILCLLPKALKMFRPQIEKCIARGARIVTYLFEVDGLKPLEFDELYSLRLYKKGDEGSAPAAAAE